MTHFKTPAPRAPWRAADGIGFRMAKELHAFDITRFVASHYYGTARTLLDDARPVGDRPELVEVAWRPVEEYGTGYGEGFTKGWELMTVGNALSNLRGAIEDNRLDPDERAQWESSGATVAMIDAAQLAEDRAYVLWLRVTGREVPPWRTAAGRDYPEDITAAAAIAATDDAFRG